MSNWRETARRVRARRDAEAFDGAGDYERDERCAIARHDGGMPETWAVSLALLQQQPRPEGVSLHDWQAALDLACRRADEHGAELAANGWSFEDVFGVGADWWRLDQRGAGWLMPGCRVVAISPDLIVYERGADRLTHHRGAH